MAQPMNEDCNRPLLEESDLPGTHQEDQEEDEEARKVPPLTSLLSRINFWIRQFHVPILVLVINIIALLLVKTSIKKAGDSLYLEYYKLPRSRGWYADDDEATRDEMRALLADARFTLSAGALAYCLIFLSDACLCLRGVQYLERMIAEHSQLDPVANSNHERGRSEDYSKALGNTTFPLLAFSREVDSLFGCTKSSQEPNSTFLRGLLYALLSFSVWGAVASGSSVAYLRWEPCMRHKLGCYRDGPWGYLSFPRKDVEIASLQYEETFSALPVSVQSWIKGKQNRIRDPVGNGTTVYEQDSPTLPYVLVTDGSVGFSYTTKNMEPDKYSTEAGVIIHPPTGKPDVVVHPMSKPPDKVSLMGIPKTAPYHGWCGVSELRETNIAFHEVICYREGNVTQHFPVVFDDETSGGSLREPSYFVSEDSLWIAHSMMLHLLRPKPGGEYSNKHRLSIVSYNISSMARTVELEKIVIEEIENRGPRSSVGLKSFCRKWYTVIFWSSLTAMLLLSAILYQRDISSCTVPGSVVFSMVSAFFLPSLGVSIALLLAACLCTGLMLASNKAQSLPSRNRALWKYVSHDMLVWAYFTLFPWLMFRLFCPRWWTRYSFEEWMDAFKTSANIAPLVLAWILGGANALLLKQPVFEILGTMLGFMLSYFLIKSLPYTSRPSSITALLVFGTITLPMGSCVLGQFCRQHHWIATVYIRRGWRQLRKLNKRRG